MKQKTIFAILSLLMLSLSSFAQAPVKGDVNEDGKVDEDDISAIIEIIKNEQNQPTYYWYVGHQNPFEMTEISPLPSNDASEGAGWRTIGTSLPTYSKTNPFWDSIYIPTATSKSTQYVALPSDQIKSRNAISGEDNTLEAWIISSDKKTLNGVEYTVWTSKNTKKSFSDLLY